MNELLYQIAVTDRKGKVLVEEIITSHTAVVMQLPEMKRLAENKLEERARQQLEEKEQA